jgi:hypothetical protein
LARAKADAVSYQIAIIGHSMSGNESSKFANDLASRGVRVELVVAFDPVEMGHVGSNIDVTKDPNATHANVEKSASFQAATMDNILKLKKI